MTVCEMEDVAVAMASKAAYAFYVESDPAASIADTGTI